MNEIIPAAGQLPASQFFTLRRLFLLLFLRGHAAQGLQRNAVPQTLIQKLAMLMLTYALIGLTSIGFSTLPIFAMATYMHATTFVFVAMFMASAAGPVLFNRDEADILMHRPIDPQILLRAKISVLIEAALWIAVAFNLSCLICGLFVKDGGVLFVVAHLISLVLEAIFTAGLVVVSYQLCLRWCGRERLESMITTVQVVLMLFLVGGSQILPRFAVANGGLVTVSAQSKWMLLMPPAWFAGVDVLINGSAEFLPVIMSVLAVVMTISVSWIAFVQLANDYQSGLQRMGETITVRSGVSSSQNWINWLTNQVPLRWWLRDPIERASFVVAIAYVVRDRDVKLRIYPSMAPMMVMPLVSLLQQRHGLASIDSLIGLMLGASMLSLLPALGISQLTISQNWRAAELFRVAPMAGPARLCHGLRRAILFFFAMPALIVFGLICTIATGSFKTLALLLPNLIAMPTFAMIATWISPYPPLSRPVEEAKAAWQGLYMIVLIIAAFSISGIACAAWLNDAYILFLIAESAVSASVYFAFHWTMSLQRWPKLD